LLRDKLTKFSYVCVLITILRNGMAQVVMIHFPGLDQSQPSQETLLCNVILSGISLSMYGFFGLYYRLCNPEHVLRPDMPDKNRRFPVKLFSFHVADVDVSTQHSALSFYSSFLAVFYALQFLGTLLEFAQVDFGLCVQNLGSLIYFALFARIVYITLLMDSQYWRSFWSAGGSFELPAAQDQEHNYTADSSEASSVVVQEVPMRPAAGIDSEDFELPSEYEVRLWKIPISLCSFVMTLGGCVVRQCFIS